MNAHCALVDRDGWVQVGEPIDLDRESFFVRVNEWVANAEIGERICYFRSWPGERPGTMPHDTQASAYEASRKGYVFLAQRRRNDEGLDYEATRISRATAIRLGLLSDGSMRI